MSEHFKVGEIAIYVRPGSQFYGREVTILSPLKPSGGGWDHVNNKPADRYMGYLVDLPKLGHREMSARPEWLRKKKPPQRDIDQKVGWEWYHEIPKASEVTA